MFLTVHASAGAIVGETLNQPLGAIFFGWLSHYVLDAIPHGDQIIGRIYKSASSYRMLQILFVIDFTVAFSLLFWLWLSGALVNPEMAMLGATAAVLPDILQGIYSISGEKILTVHAKWHAWNPDKWRSCFAVHRFRYSVLNALSDLVF
jgi:hypothetical protein